MSAPEEKKSEGPVLQARYRGARMADRGVQHLYTMLDENSEGGEKEVWFRRKLPADHRIGDLVRVREEEPGRYSTVGKMDGTFVEGHIDSPEDEAVSMAAIRAARHLREKSALARRSDLREALEPLRRAYMRLNDHGRAGLITGVIAVMMTWSAAGWPGTGKGRKKS